MSKLRQRNIITYHSNSHHESQTTEHQRKLKERYLRRYATRNDQKTVDKLELINQDESSAEEDFVTVTMREVKNEMNKQTPMSKA